MNKVNIKTISLDLLDRELKDMGLEGFRTSQVKRWLYKFDVKSFDQMTNIGKKYREQLAEKYTIGQLEIVDHQKSQDGTIKFLIQLEDEHKIEAVCIPAEDRRTLCISTQVGCGMACRFCLTGTMGIIRNLSQYEILEQVACVKRFLKEDKISNIVFMGMGEPLANTKNLYPSIAILIDSECFDLSHNHVTVSTCGIAPEIEKFSNHTTAKLAISLNATTDEVRDEIMPINKKYNLKQLIQACHNMNLPKRDRITFEYVMLHGLNDSMEDAKRLVKLLEGLRVKINLLPFNESPQMVYKRPPQEHVKKFQEYLLNKGLFAIERKSRGSDILGACGQLVTTKTDNQ
ncbi:MAG: 23S rRNA (adenine(2503)-C(2))-methyltransferase RlmN [bacterium]|nr:23S rRNA (adenine(2503)-C(2))-methyltransferase RlmN [bacterium]MBU1916644.1 23S rRNA (adenine(2503)-C(2))-methyltransferase RlmN [bacterium]